jgi:hypothetical protein
MALELDAMRAPGFSGHVEFGPPDKVCHPPTREDTFCEWEFSAVLYHLVLDTACGLRVSASALAQVGGDECPVCGRRLLVSGATRGD